MTIIRNRPSNKRQLYGYGRKNTNDKGRKMRSR